MEQDFNIEEEYEKYKASQQGPDTRPEWMRSAEEDLKGFLEKPEFKLSPNVINWLNNKSECPYCKKMLTTASFEFHKKTCKSDSDKIFLFLEKNPDSTILELEKYCGFSRPKILKIFKQHNYVHKFSNSVNFTTHKDLRKKFIEGAKKGANTQAEKTKLITQEKFRKIWNELPNDIFESPLIRHVIKKLNFGSANFKKFIDENWVTMVYKGTKSSSTNPTLYIKNLSKSLEKNYEPLAVTNASIQLKLEDIKRKLLDSNASQKIV
jgi:hypothetical protein